MIKEIIKLNRLGWGDFQADGTPKIKFDGCKDEWVPGINAVTGQLRVDIPKERREELESSKFLDLEPNALSKNSSFWDSYKFIIKNGYTKINTANPNHALLYELMKLDPTVAQSREEAEKSTKFEWVMSSRTEEAKVKNKSQSLKTEAYVLFSSMTDADISNTLTMLGVNVEDTDLEVKRNILGTWVENKTKDFLKVAKDSNKEDKVWLINLIKKGIIKKDGFGSLDTCYFTYKDIKLNEKNPGLDEAIKFINSPINQEILIGLKKIEG